MTQQLCIFRDEIDGDAGDPVARLATQREDGRWDVAGVDRWTYDTDELLFIRIEA